MIRQLSVCLFLTLASAAHANTFIVDVGGANLVFTPQTLNINKGDTVTFINKGGFHNVVADDGSFTCARGCDGDGMGGNGAPSLDNWIASVTFTRVGNQGYYCEIHGQPGKNMFGTIIVQGVSPPPPLTSEVPGGGALLSVLLAVALALGATVRLRRRRL
jgi:plastocyanin